MLNRLCISSLLLCLSSTVHAQEGAPGFVRLRVSGSGAETFELAETTVAEELQLAQSQATQQPTQQPQPPLAPPTGTDTLPPPPPSALEQFTGANPLANLFATTQPQRRRRRSRRLARAPDMFGDLFGTGGSGGQSVVTVPMSFTATAFAFFEMAPTNQVIGQFIGNNPVPGSGMMGNTSLSNLTATQLNALLGANPNASFALQENNVSTNFLNQNPGNFVNGATAVAFSQASATAVDPNDVIMLFPPQAGGFSATPIFVNFDVTETYDFLIFVDVASPGSGGLVVGRQKIAENTSPIPQDRIFWNYSYFENVPIFREGVNVSRNTPGFEKTFLDGNASIEMRFPFAATLDSNIQLNGMTNTNEMEFGNIVTTLKALVHSNDVLGVSVGMSVSLPTADDLTFQMFGTDVVRVENESVHLLPFLGALYSPNDRFFAQGFLQFDFDANGNPVLINVPGTGMVNAGRANDTSFLYADVGVGYWLLRDDSSNKFINGIAPTLELHYNKSLQETDIVTMGNTVVGNFADNVEILNAVFGVTFTLAGNSNLGLAYVTPIGGGADQQFDGEFRATFNWFFGGDR